MTYMVVEWLVWRWFGFVQGVTMRSSHHTGASEIYQLSISIEQMKRKILTSLAMYIYSRLRKSIFLHLGQVLYRHHLRDASCDVRVLVWRIACQSLKWTEVWSHNVSHAFRSCRACESGLWYPCHHALCRIPIVWAQDSQRSRYLYEREIQCCSSYDVVIILLDLHLSTL